MKATYGEVDGEGREIYKDPITDDGTKKSAKGLLCVDRNPESGKLELEDQVTKDRESQGEMITVFRDGILLVDQSLAEIRARVAKQEFSVAIQA
jgi:nicotinamide phosphoribosyltransferase